MLLHRLVCCGLVNLRNPGPVLCLCADTNKWRGSDRGYQILCAEAGGQIFPWKVLITDVPVCLTAQSISEKSRGFQYLRDFDLNPKVFPERACSIRYVGTFWCSPDTQTSNQIRAEQSIQRPPRKRSKQLLRIKRMT